MLFQGTYDAARDLEVPAGVDMVVKFDGGGASAATVTDVYTKLRVTELTTPTLTATTADINGGTLDNSVIGGTTAAAITGTTIVANTSLNIAGDGATVTGIKDEDDMSSNSPTKLATQQSIKAYVDSQVGTVDTWAEVLANGATSGSTNPEVTAGQALKTDTINETTAGSGVTIDSVLLKDDVVNATDVETGSISANDGTASATIANSTGVMTIASSVLTTTDINGGSIDGTNIGASSAGTGAFTTLTASGNFTVDTNTFFVDASGNQVAIGTTSPESRLTIHSGAGLDGQIFDAYYGSGNNQPLNIGINRSSGNAWLGWNALQSTTDTQNYQVNNVAGRIDGSVGGVKVLGAASGTAGDAITWVTAAEFAYDGSIFNEGGNSIDFRVESDSNTHMLFVDASANAVGINNSAPTGVKLSVLGASTAALGWGDVSDRGFLSFDGSGNPIVRAGSGLGIKIQANSTQNIAHLGAAGESYAVVFNQDGNDQDFRVESNGSTHALFVEGDGTGVGINTSNPQEALHVTGTVRLDANNSGVTTGDAVNQIIFRDNDTTTGGGQPMGDIDFVTQDSGNEGVSGRIRVAAESASTGDGRMTFSTGRVGTLANNLTMTSTEAAFNQAGADMDFRVESDSNTHMLFVDASNDHVNIGSDLNMGGQLNILGDEGIRGRKSSSYKTATMVQPTAWGYSVGTYAVTQLGDQSTQGTVSIGYDPSGNPDGSFSGTGIEMLFAGDIHFYQPNSADTGWKRQFRMINTTGVILNENSDADLDLRVESDNNNQALLVDAGGDFVAFGNTVKNPASGFSDQHGVGIDVANGDVQIASDSTPLQINRTTTAGANGDFIIFRNSGATRAKIAVESTDNLMISAMSGGGAGLLFWGAGGTTPNISPAKEGVVIDDAVGLGRSNERFTYLYLSDGLRADGKDGSSTIFNEGSTTSDFRIESNDYTHMFSLDGGSNEITIAGSNNSANATLALNNISGKHGKSIHSHNTISGSSEAAIMAEGTFVADTTSAGTTLSIPVFSQSSVWRRYVVEFMFSSGEYNDSGNGSMGQLP